MKSEPPSTPSPTPVPDQIVAGLAKVALAYRHQQWQAAGKSGLTPTQSLILAAAAGAEDRGSPLGIKGIAKELAVTMSTASEAVSALVSRGLLQKREADGDGRAVTLHLTARGRRAMEAAPEWPGAMAEAAAAMSEEERAAMLRGLVGLIRAMQERELIPTQRMCVECSFFEPNRYTGPKPHHCGFVNAPMADSDLRLDCADMRPAQPEKRVWPVFVGGRERETARPDERAPKADAPA